MLNDVVPCIICLRQTLLPILWKSNDPALGPALLSRSRSVQCFNFVSFHILGLFARLWNFFTGSAGQSCFFNHIRGIVATAMQKNQGDISCRNAKSTREIEAATIQQIPGGQQPPHMQKVPRGQKPRNTKKIPGRQKSLQYKKYQGDRSRPKGRTVIFLTGGVGKF